MEKRKKNRIKSIIACVCVAVVVILLAVFPMLASSAAGNADAASILSATVQTGSVTRKILGGGALAEEDSVGVTVPAEVKLTEFLANNGAHVKEGDPIARVDRVSVMQAISQIQETMGHIARDIEKESEKTNSQTVLAEAGGTVKILYATEGSLVRDVMLEHGALAVLSLDNKMALQLEGSFPLAAGEPVTLILADGTLAEGKVESNLDGALVISFTDKDYEVGQTVTVKDRSGNLLGSAELYILNPWNAVAYTGQVSQIKVREGQTLSAGKTLMKLDDTGYTATYQQLCDEYREYEDMMLELFQMYQTQIVTAPCDGVVSGIDEDSSMLLSAAGGTYTLSLLANAPNGDDEMLYFNYAGTVTALTETEYEMLMDPQHLEIADYLDLSGITLDPATMTEKVNFPMDLVPIYQASEGIWQQLEPQQISVGDILLVVCDEEGNFIWIVRIQA